MNAITFEKYKRLKSEIEYHNETLQTILTGNFAAVNDAMYNDRPGSPSVSVIHVTAVRQIPDAAGKEGTLRGTVAMGGNMLTLIFSMLKAFSDSPEFLEVVKESVQVWDGMQREGKDLNDFNF